MKTTIGLLLLFILTQAIPAQSVSFWAELTKLCGKAYVGKVEAAPADDTTFKGKDLVMHIRRCDKNRIFVPFFVGEDRSRTWVFTKLKNGRIELKHDHRHEDGTPDKVTMYGGTSPNVGSAIRQMFTAEEETVKVIAAAATNVWWVDLVAGSHFTYNLRRIGTERYFSIRFDLKTEAPAQPAPWGWVDKK
ncbi:MAG: hypothetical protein IPN69_17665 [Acidobacteria bacterium]|nr:hypothetical protein [Acidobacteriota bacterium]